MTAQGEIIKASAKENPNLFWGLKGLGFNFGYVVFRGTKLEHVDKIEIAEKKGEHRVGKENMRK